MDDAAIQRIRVVFSERHKIGQKSWKNLEKNRVKCIVTNTMSI